MTASDSVHSRRLAASALGVLALALVFFASYHDYGLAPFDEGVHLEGIRLQAEGRMDPARFTHYSAQYRWFAAALPGGEPNLELIRLVWVALRALTALLIFLVARRLLPSAWPVLPVACFLALPGPWHKSIVPWTVCLCLYAVTRTLATGKVLWYCALGVALSVAFALHPYTGVLSGAAWLLLVVLTPAARYGAADGSRTLARAVRWHAPFAVTVLVLTFAPADFFRQVSPLDLLGQNASLVSSIIPGSRFFAAHLVAGASDPRVALTLSLYLMVLPILVAGVWMVRHPAGTGLDARGRLVVLALVVMGALNLAKWVVRLDLAHLIQNAPPLWILLALVLQRGVVGAGAARAGTSPRRAPFRRYGVMIAVAVLALWLAAVVAFGVTSSDTFVGGIGLRLATETAPLVHPHGVLHVAPGMAATLTSLSTVIRDSSARGDALLVSANPKILHYLTGRPGPLVMPAFAFPANFQSNPIEEVIAEIEARNTTLVVFDERPIIPLDDYRLRVLAPPLYAFIMGDYELLTEVEGMQVRSRRDVEVPR
jgi:hypothetical protein